MRLFFKIIISSVFFLAATPSSVFGQGIRVSQDTVTFDGNITSESTEKLIKTIRSRPVKKLIINSFGGEAMAGLELALELQQRHITVEVSKYCISTCANYIFLSADKKILLPNAILGFHGGVSLKNVDGSDNLTLGLYVKKIHELEDRVFQGTHFDKSLFDVSYDLTKPPTNDEYFLVEIDGKEERRFLVVNGDRDAPLEEVAKFIVEARSKGLTTNLKYHYQGLSKNKVYFPSLKTLKSYGVEGITKYPYPPNAEAMRKLAKTILETMEIVGDFK